MTLRTFARLGAAVLLAGGLASAAAAPAYAADPTPDLTVTAAGLTPAAGASTTFARITVTNRSAVRATGVVVSVDLTGLDTSKVVVPTEVPGCRVETDQMLCRVGSIAPHNRAKTIVTLSVAKGAAGPAGVVRFGVAADQPDPHDADNYVELPVTVGPAGPNLFVLASDAPVKDDGTVGAIAPGGTGPFGYVVVNQGSVGARGFTATINLPKQTTFVGSYPKCAISTDRRTATCNYSDVTLPSLGSTDPGDTGSPAYVSALMTVKVDATAKAGVVLTDGLVTVKDTGAVVTASSTRRSLVVTRLPANLKRISRLPADVDPSDNTDAFSVYVAGKPGSGKPTAPSTPGTGGQGGGTGSGGLPVTGPAVVGIGLGGLAVVALGIVLFVITRRRRVVLVTPADEA